MREIAKANRKAVHALRHRAIAVAGAMAIASVGVASTAGATPTPPARTTITSGINGYDQATISFSGSNGDNFSIAYSTDPSMGSPTVAGTQTGTAAYSISGLTGGIAYYVQVADTTNASVSNIVRVKPYSVPQAPTSVTATRVDNTDVSVSWTAPSNNGGSSIIGYEITPYAGGVPQATVYDYAPTPTTGTVSGLTPGSTYTFAVSAENAYGTGAPSADSNSVLEAIPPAAPTITAATPGSTWVHVFWTAPSDDGGSPVTGYTIQTYVGGVLQPTFATLPATLISSTTDAYVQGLTNGTAYTFTVTAVNAAGSGTPSAASAPTTPAGPAFGVTGFAVTPGNAVANLSWTGANANGSAITSWTVLEWINGVAQPSITGISAGATSYQVTGLNNGTTYQFKIAPVNGLGTGSPSTGEVVTPSTTPGTATNLVASPSSHGKATLTWTAPSDGGLTMHYTIYAHRGSSVIATASNVSGSVTSATITGISSGSGTTFTIIATNGNGSGVESGPSNAITVS